mgnify:CR=1 FL=1
MGVPLYVLEDKLLELLTEKKKLRKILAQNSAKEEGSWGQVLSQTNWKIWILSQKNQKILAGGGTPINGSFIVFCSNLGKCILLVHWSKY